MKLEKSEDGHYTLSYAERKVLVSEGHVDREVRRLEILSPQQLCEIERIRMDDSEYQSVFKMLVVSVDKFDQTLAAYEQMLTAIRFEKLTSIEDRFVIRHKQSVEAAIRHRLALNSLYELYDLHGGDFRKIIAKIGGPGRSSRSKCKVGKTLSRFLLWHERRSATGEYRESMPDGIHELSGMNRLCQFSSATSIDTIVNSLEEPIAFRLLENPMVVREIGADTNSPNHLSQFTSGEIKRITRDLKTNYYSLDWLMGQSELKEDRKSKNGEKGDVENLVTSVLSAIDRDKEISRQSFEVNREIYKRLKALKKSVEDNPMRVKQADFSNLKKEIRQITLWHFMTEHQFGKTMHDVFDVDFMSDDVSEEREMWLL